MKIRSFINLSLFTFSLIFPPLMSSAQAQSKPVLNIQEWQTSQGSPVYFVQTPEIPMVDVKIIFTAGSAYDGDQWGLANLVGSTLEEGTKTHNADEIANAFDQVGAQFSSDTSRDLTVLSLRSLNEPKYLTPALQIFAEIVSQASFPDGAISRVKQQTISAIRSEKQNPSAVATDAFFENLYPGHPYAHPVLGSEKNVESLTKNQITDFYQRYFAASNARIIIVGDLDKSAAEKLAEGLLSGLPKGSPATALQAENKPASGLHALEFPSQQTTIVTGQLGIDRQSTEYFPLMVGNYLLGQMPLDSLLFEQVRNQRGLAYSISSSFSPMTYRGPFAVVLQTRTAEKKQALSVIQEVLRQYVNQGPTANQLQLAKQNIINHFPLNLSTNDQIAAALMQIAVNQRPINYLDTYRDKVNLVTAEQVKQTFQALIDPDKMLTITVGQK